MSSWKVWFSDRGRFFQKRKWPFGFLPLWAVLILSLYLAGCATTSTVRIREKSSAAKKGEATATVRQVEDLNPEALPDSIFKVSEKSPLPEQSSEIHLQQEVTKEDTAREIIEEKPGYRIQIAALSNQDEAMQIKKEAMLKFAEQGVYLIFDPPFYKIRVGDFVSRYDAEKLQQKAIQLGYKDAWIVRTRVKVKKIE